MFASTFGQVSFSPWLPIFISSLAVPVCMLWLSVRQQRGGITFLHKLLLFCAVLSPVLIGSIAHWLPGHCFNGPSLAFAVVVNLVFAAASFCVFPSGRTVLRLLYLVAFGLLVLFESAVAVVLGTAAAAGYYSDQKIASFDALPQAEKDACVPPALLDSVVGVPMPAFHVARYSKETFGGADTYFLTLESEISQQALAAMADSVRSSSHRWMFYHGEYQVRLTPVGEHFECLNINPDQGSAFWETSGR